MGLFDRLLKKNQEDKKVDEIAKKVEQIRQMSLTNPLNEAIEDLKGYLSDVYSEGVISKEKYDAYCKDISELLSKENLSSFDINGVRVRIKEDELLSEYENEEVEEICDELMNYDNLEIINGTTVTAMEIYKKCYDKISSSDIMHDNPELKNQKLGVLQKQISTIKEAKVKENNGNITPEYILEKQESARKSYCCSKQKKVREFYDCIIRGSAKIESCTELSYIRHAIYKLNKNSYVESNKKTQLLDELLKRKEELRQIKYGNKLKNVDQESKTLDVRESEQVITQKKASLLSDNKISIDTTPAFTEDELKMLSLMANYYFQMTVAELEKERQMLTSVIEQNTLSPSGANMARERLKIVNQTLEKTNSISKYV